MNFLRIKFGEVWTCGEQDLGENVRDCFANFVIGSKESSTALKVVFHRQGSSSFQINGCSERFNSVVVHVSSPQGAVYGWNKGKKNESHFVVCFILLFKYLKVVSIELNRKATADANIELLTRDTKPWSEDLKFYWYFGHAGVQRAVVRSSLKLGKAMTRKLEQLTQIKPWRYLVPDALHKF